MILMSYVEGTHFGAAMPLEGINGLTPCAKNGAALLERGTLWGRVNGIRLMGGVFSRYRSSRIAAPVQAMMEPMMELWAGMRRSMIPVMMSRAMG